MQTPVHKLTGEIAEHIEISEKVFGAPFNESVVHQVLLSQRANARQGTASTKTRSEVAGSTRKLFRQKGTGFARAGSIRSPLRRGGGIAFGPKPRDYRQTVPRKMRRLAIRCALSAKVGNEELIITEPFTLEEPKTKEMARILKTLGADASVLIVTAEAEENVVKSARNLPGVKTIPARLLNVVDIISHKMIFMTTTAARRVEELWGEKPVGGGNSEPVSGAETTADN